jgi:hypothetical protein
MAGDGGYGRGRMVNSFAAKVQEKLGILAFSSEQRAVDYLGMARPRLRADLSATMSRISQYSWRDKEPLSTLNHTK